jgi:hypothetical protein
MRGCAILRDGIGARCGIPWSLGLDMEVGMSLQAAEVQALQQFSLGQTHAERFSYDAGADALTLKARSWGERLVRLLKTLITFGRRDGFADMRWPLIAQKIQDKAHALFASLESDPRVALIRSGLRSKVMACNASFRANHPKWEQKQDLAAVIRAIDTWVGRSSNWRTIATPSAS